MNANFPVGTRNKRTFNRHRRHTDTSNMTATDRPYKEWEKCHINQKHSPNSRDSTRSNSSPYPATLDAVTRVDN